MPGVNGNRWWHWPLPATVILVSSIAAIFVAGVQFSQLRGDVLDERLYQTREIQEGLSALHRDLQMVGHLIAMPSEAEAINYVAARRDQMGAIRWLGYLPSAGERPHVLLASAEIRGYDPRRDPELAPLLNRVGEGTLTASVPGSHRELASLAMVLGQAGDGHGALVALVDIEDFLDNNLSALAHAHAPHVDIVLDGRPIGHWPHVPTLHTHAAKEWEHSSQISIGPQQFTLSFSRIDPLTTLARMAPQPLALLLGGLALAASVRGRRQPIPQSGVPVEPEQRAASISPGDVHRSRLWQLGELAATLSHDLGQPLNIIRLSAESSQDAIAHGRLDGERLNRALGNASAQTLRAQAMIDAVVNAARQPSRPPVHIVPVEVVRRALAEVMPQIRAQRVGLSWHADLDTPKVLGHSTRLGAAVRHLLINAIEAIACRALDEGNGTLTVDCRPHGDDIAITVADDGPGFPAALLPLLNTPLTATTERTKGCGLGLTIALGVTAEMGGSISIAEGNPGTRVTLLLPAARRTLLLVEDEDAAARELADYISAKGWRVHIASGGNPALELFRSVGADAVITDLNMPDGDGWHLIGQLRVLAPDLPIIAISTADGDDARRAVTAGAALVLRKPVSLAELYDELEELLDDSG